METDQQAAGIRDAGPDGDKENDQNPGNHGTSGQPPSGTRSRSRAKRNATKVKLGEGIKDRPNIAKLLAGLEPQSPFELVDRDTSTEEEEESEAEKESTASRVKKRKPAFVNKNNETSTKEIPGNTAKAQASPSAIRPSRPRNGTPNPPPLHRHRHQRPP